MKLLKPVKAGRVSPTYKVLIEVDGDRIRFNGEAFPDLHRRSFVVLRSVGDKLIKVSGHREHWVYMATPNDSTLWLNTSEDWVDIRTAGYRPCEEYKAFLQGTLHDLEWVTDGGRLTGYAPEGWGVQ